MCPTTARSQNIANVVEAERSLLLTFTRKFALAGALALSVIAPIIISGCDSSSPTATVVTSAPTPISTIEGTIPEAVGTSAPQAVGTGEPQAVPSTAPTIPAK
jgi:hypothetical protein